MRAQHIHWGRTFHPPCTPPSSVSVSVFPSVPSFHTCPYLTITCIRIKLKLAVWAAGFRSLIFLVIIMGYRHHPPPPNFVNGLPTFHGLDCRRYVWGNFGTMCDQDPWAARMFQKSSKQLKACSKRKSNVLRSGLVFLLFLDKPQPQLVAQCGNTKKIGSKPQKTAKNRSKSVWTGLNCSQLKLIGTSIY